MARSLPFRLKGDPVRTCTKVYKNYTSYKDHLSADFNGRCGYCDCHHKWYGGINSFHIDHFAPQSKFKAIKSTYTNLVYSCPHCNMAKGDDWPSDSHELSVVNQKGYVDPCSKHYPALFSRDATGRIIPLSTIGASMYTNLKFFLSCRRVIWMLGLLLHLASELKELRKHSKLNQEMKSRLDEMYKEIFDYLLDYLELHNQ